MSQHLGLLVLSVGYLQERYTKQRGEQEVRHERICSLGGGGGEISEITSCKITNNYNNAYIVQPEVSQDSISYILVKST